MSQRSERGVYLKALSGRKATGLASALVALIIAGVVTSSMLLGDRAAQPAPPQPGGQDPADFNYAQRVDASAGHDGIDLQVTGFVADETQTVVSFVLTGRESEGTVETGSGVFLFDADGTSYRARSGSTDQSDPRHETAIFPPIPAKAGTVALQLEDLTIDPARTGQNIEEVSGVWKAEVNWDGSPAPPGPTVKAPVGPLPFGPGSITLTSIQQAATGTVISGTLDGFALDAIEDMDCPAQSLIAADGTSVPLTGCHFGFGDGDRSFEIRYPPTSGKATLTFVLSFPPLHSPPEPTLSPGSAAAAGAKATFELDLPAREN